MTEKEIILMNRADFGYKVGDIVTIVDNLDFHENISPAVIPEMKFRCSKSYEISSKAYGDTFQFRLKGQPCSWTNAMFQESYYKKEPLFYNVSELVTLI